MTALTNALEALCRSRGAGVALIDHGRRVTHSELDRMQGRFAGWLRRQGLAPGQVVGLTIRNDVRHLVAALALMRMGHAHVPLASFEPLAMRGELARRCDVDCVIVDEPGVALPDHAALCPDFDAIFEDPSLDDAGGPMRGGEAPFLILASSGTTGRPKLVTRTEQQVFNFGYPDIPGTTTSFLHYPVESNGGKWTSLGMLARGITLVYADAERMALEEIRALYGVDRLHLYPAKLEAAVRAAAAAGREGVVAGAHLFTGGVQVDASLRSATQSRLTANLHVLFGATECGIATVAGPTVHATRPDSIGAPVPGVEIRIVDDSGRQVPVGDPGFIRVRSPWIATGYLDDAEASARVFRDGWFQPGDVGRMNPAGELVFLGRGDDMMILNSINIFPAEIERVAEEFPGVIECAAFPVRSSVYGDIPVLAVVARADFPTQSLASWCRQRLGSRAPRKVILLDALPRNTLGKVLRRELSTRMAGALTEDRPAP